MCVGYLIIFKLFSCYLRKIWCTILKKVKKFVKKTLTIQFSIHSKFRNCPIISNVFSQPQNQFFTETNIFQKKHAKLNFCVDNAVLNTENWFFLRFSALFFSKTLKTLTFCIACLCYLWTMSDILKIRNLRKIILKTFIQFSSFAMYCNCKTVEPFLNLFLSKHWFTSLVFAYDHIPKTLTNQIFFKIIPYRFLEKCFSLNFKWWKTTYHRHQSIFCFYRIAWKVYD